MPLIRVTVFFAKFSQREYCGWFLEQLNLNTHVHITDTCCCLFSRVSRTSCSHNNWWILIFFESFLALQESNHCLLLVQSEALESTMNVCLSFSLEVLIGGEAALLTSLGLKNLCRFAGLSMSAGETSVELDNIHVHPSVNGWSHSGKSVSGRRGSNCRVNFTSASASDVVAPATPVPKEALLLRWDERRLEWVHHTENMRWEALIARKALRRKQITIQQSSQVKEWIDKHVETRSLLKHQRSGYMNQPKSQNLIKMRITNKYGETRIQTYKNGCKNSERILWMKFVPEHRDSHASSSHEPSLEPKRSVDLGKHSVCTHRNCEILQRTKITRGPSKTHWRSRTSCRQF